MTPSLDGRIAVVSGGGRGLGRAIAGELARHGARIVLGARHVPSLEESEREIREAGGEAYAIPVDVSSEDSVDVFSREVEHRVGRASILVNAAGVYGPIAPIEDTVARDWIHTLMINTVGPFLMIRAFLPGMLADRWGRIVSLTSAASLHPPGPLTSAYGTSKVALNQLTRHLAAEIMGTGVTANVIHPGDVKTGMWADIKARVAGMGPAGEPYRQWATWVAGNGGDPPEKAAALVLRLVSDKEGSVNGRFLWIDEPLQAPIPSWDEPAATQPWRK
jgi:NAD(P)-dependent dehydrogenase (short-subunit alcohol dehydrogenase family)